MLSAQVVTPDVFSPVVNSLLEERDLGLLLSAATMLQGVCARNGAGKGLCHIQALQLSHSLGASAAHSYTVSVEHIRAKPSTPSAKQGQVLQCSRSAAP